MITFCYIGGPQLYQVLRRHLRPGLAYSQPEALTCKAYSFNSPPSHEQRLPETPTFITGGRIPYRIRWHFINVSAQITIFRKAIQRNLLNSAVDGVDRRLLLIDTVKVDSFEHRWHGWHFERLRFAILFEKVVSPQSIFLGFKAPIASYFSYFLRKK